MNKSVIIYILGIIFLTTCTHEVNLMHDVRTIYENKLSKHLICIQETDLGSKSTSVSPFDTASIHFVKYTSMEVIPGGTIGTYHHIEFYKECIYILEDTCSYCLRYKDSLSEDDEFYLERIRFTSINDDYLRAINIDTLTIDSTLLQIFKKDYTMLEKFEEYYKGEE